MKAPEEAFREVILAEFRHPAHRGGPGAGHVSGRARNRTCGDEVSIHLRFDGERVGDARQQAEGCAVTTATASLLTGHLAGLDAEGVRELLKAVHTVVCEGGDPSGLPGKLGALGAVAPLTSRHRCVGVVLEAVDRALEARESHGGA